MEGNRPHKRRSRLAGWLLVCGTGGLLLASQSCTSVGYYVQCARGQFDLLSCRRPIDEVLADPATSPALRDQLLEARAAREFASRELLLPDNGSYRSYADLNRPYVVWNVVAAPEFSLEPMTWCFPVAGCVSYRGYFAEDAARAFAAGLARQGKDVVVYGTTAYSTLGWFDDPVLNTFIGGSSLHTAGLIFHELAHQQLYLKGDSAFSEAFARTVETEGLRRWLESRGRPEEFARHQQQRRFQADFLALVERARARLAELYAGPLAADAMRQGKEAILADLRQEYREQKEAWGGYAGYDRWFDQELNNARFVSVSTYQDYVPAFQELLRRQGHDLAAFYREAGRLAGLPADRRRAHLAELGAPTAVAESPVSPPML